MDCRSKKIDSVIEERKQIYDAVNNVAALQEKALLHSYGVASSGSDFSFSGASDSESEMLSEPEMLSELLVSGKDSVESQIAAEELIGKKYLNSVSLTGLSS